MSACRRVWDFTRLPFRYLPQIAALATMLLGEVLLFHTLKKDVASRSRTLHQQRFWPAVYPLYVTPKAFKRSMAAAGEGLSYTRQPRLLAEAI
jgi:hypothetical protein